MKGVALLCSVPPSGSGGIVGRYFLRKPLTALDITLAVAMKRACVDADLCRKVFFSKHLPDSLLRRYMGHFLEDSRVGLNIGDALGRFPSKTCKGSDGKAGWLGRAPAMLVMGAEDDVIVDVEGFEETAAFYATPRTTRVLCPGPHEVMLDQWADPAARFCEWARAL